MYCFAINNHDHRTHMYVHKTNISSHRTEHTTTVIGFNTYYTIDRHLAVLTSIDSILYEYLHIGPLCSYLI